MILSLILVWLENWSFRGPSFAQNTVLSYQILAKKFVHLMIAVDALYMAVFSRRGANQNFVGQWVEQILKLFFLLGGSFDSQEQVYLSSVVRIGKKFNTEDNKQVGEALKEGFDLAELLSLDQSNQKASKGKSNALNHRCWPICA